MNEIQVFNNETFGKIRVIERDHEPWFVAVDVCRALELGDVRKAMSRLDEDEGTLLEITHPQSPTKAIQVNAVNEPGLYALVLGSRKPEVKAFKRWITHEVLPSIRRTGSYSTNSQPKTAPLPSESASGVAKLITVIRLVMRDNGQPPEAVSQAVKGLCEQFGVTLPANFVRESPFEQLCFWPRSIP